MSVAHCLTLGAASFALLLVGCDHRDPVAPPGRPQAAVAKAPTDTRARPTNSSAIQITWTDQATNEDGFRIERSPDSVGPWLLAGTTSANVISFVDVGRPSEVLVCYRVIATKRNNRSNPSEADCTAPPAAPTNLMITGVDETTVDLVWTDNSAVEDGYEVQRGAAASGPYTVVAHVGRNGVSYRDGGLAAGTTSWYRVRPERDGGIGGFGDFSNTASGVPVPGAPLAPTGTTARPTFVGGVGVSWTDRSTNEDGFRVERSFDEGLTWGIVFPLRPNTTSVGDFYGAPAEQRVCYRVFAFNELGDSPASNMACTTPPAGPTGLAVVAVNNETLELRWTDNSAVEDGYEIRRATAYDGVYSIIATTPANTTSYQDVGVTSNATYWYVVRATKDGGTSPYSNYASGVTATTVPATPSGTVARPLSSTTIGFYWTDNATNAEGFRAERSLDDGTSWVTAGTTGPAPYRSQGFLDGGRKSEQRVCYRVFAFNSQGDSPPSTMSCATPPAAPTNLTATWREDGVLLTWTDNSAVEDGYEVRVVGGEGYCAFSDLEPNSTSYLYWDPTGTCFWWVEVMALNDGGWSDVVTLYLSASSGSSLSGAGVGRSRRP